VRSVGLVGVGLLGLALTERLIGAGFRVLGYDLLETRRHELVALGGVAVATSAEVFQQCDIVVLCLPDSSVVASVLDGAQPDLRQGLLLVDTTTGDPFDTAALGNSLSSRGVEYLDATVAGSSAVVRGGAAIVMAGGSERAFHAAGGVLGAFASGVFHVGPCGSGARMKLVVNLVLGLNRAALAEGLTLAKSLGLDPAAALEVLRSGAAYSQAMDDKGAKMLAGDFSPQARLAQHLKDVRLMLDAAARTGTELPLSKLHRTLLERAETAGLGELDNSAIFRVFEMLQSAGGGQRLAESIDEPRES
jgi:3-hydroxyisobutyrate dehydrogenase-like beta-hydroxyacid dehydrogenase